MRKTTLFILCTVILILSIIPTHTFAYEANAYVRVGLFFGTGAKESFSAVSGDGVTVIGHTYGYDFYPHFTVNSAKTEVSKISGTYYLSTPYSTPREAADAATALRLAGKESYYGYINSSYYAVLNTAEEGFSAKELSSFAVKAVCGEHHIIFDHHAEIFSFKSESSHMEFNGRRYMGSLLASRLTSDNISVINNVPTDDYVASVVGSEMFSSWPIEALKAQAVVARTYMTTVTSYDKYGIDVTDDTRTQAYKGLSSVTESTRQSAYDTSGVVILYNGAPAQTFFSSSNGGIIADVYSAWGGGAGLDYLSSSPDPYEDQSIDGIVWQTTLTPEEIKVKLAGSGVDIGDITDVAVTKRGEKDMRVHELTFYGTKGTHSVKFDKARTLLGLKSQYYYISSPGTGGNVSVLGGNGISSISLVSSKVLGASAMIQLGTKMTFMSAYEEQTYTPPAVKTSYVFDGRGFGHGVGMSQYGAKGMAEAGFGYRDIIAFYYKGTTLSK